MALIECPECNRKNVSDTAEMCPCCGYGIKAHFVEVERKKEIERQVELSAIKMPKKPSLGESVIVCGIIFAPLMLFNLIFPYNLGFWLFCVIWLIVSFFTYKSKVNDYEITRQNLKKYQEDELVRRKKELEKNIAKTIAKCPMCSSKNISKISLTSRVLSVWMIGLASGKIGKQYKCNDCKHMW